MTTSLPRTDPRTPPRAGDGPLRVAVVGAGTIGRIHARAAASVPGIEVVAVVDPSAPAAALFQEQVRRDALSTCTPGDGALTGDASATPRHVRSLAEIERGTVDLAAVCTPSGTHVDLALEAIEAGLHVLVEKPVDVDLRSAVRLLEASALARSRGQVVSVVSQHRFDPDVATVRALVAQGRLGRLTSAIASVAWWRSQAYYGSAPWRGTWEMDGGGALMNQGIHTVDLLLSFLGRPQEVTAFTATTSHTRIEVEDVAVAAMRFGSGAVAVLHATTNAYPGLGTRIQLMGDDGSALLDEERLTYLHLRGAAAETAGDMGGVREDDQSARHADTDAATWKDATSDELGHARQYADVLRAVRENGSPQVTVEDGVLALATVLSTYLAARTGYAVRIDEVLAGAYDEEIDRLRAP